MAYAMGVAVGRTLGRDLEGYVELGIGAKGGSDAASLAAVGGGLIYRVGPDVQVYAGGHVGIARAAEDWSTFVGVAFRF